MPVNGIPISGTASASTYQNFDGSNVTIAGLEEKAYTPKASASAFLGLGSNFKDNTYAVIDLKGSYNYDEKGIFNQNLRIRNTIGTGGSATQIRYSPISVNIPINKSTSFYANPHYVGKVNYENNKWSNSAGIFAGISKKVSKNTTISIEAQRYNLQDIKDNSGKNWGINAILTYKL